MSSLLLSKKEIEDCQEIVNNFRVNELHLLLTSYHYPKLGKKQDLVARAQSILANPKYQLSAVQKVREIQTNNRIRNVSQPYLSASSMQPSNNSGDMIRRAAYQSQYQSGSMAANRNNQVHAQQPPFMANSYNGSSSYGAYPHLQQGMNSSMAYGHSLASATSVSQVRNMRIVDLPFYNVQSTVTALTELPAFNMQPRPGEAKKEFFFGVLQQDIARLSYRGEERPLPRYEIQLRMFLLDTSEEQQDAFPPGCTIKVDDYNVTLPNIIPTNKPNAEQKRLSRPVNLTPYCQPPRGRDGRQHRLLIEWVGDKRAWAFGIYIVLRVNAPILQDRILKNPNAKRSFDSTKATIVRRLNGTDDDDGIEMDTLKISLLCPLMRTAIKIPARAVDCTHLQSFDLTNYLMMCEKRPVWKCPVCDKNALYQKLIVDGYFSTLLSSVGEGVEEVELLKDGTWRIIKDELLDLSDDDDEDCVVSSEKNVKKVIAPAKDVVKKITIPTAKEILPSEDIITLSDSDNEDLPGNVSNVDLNDSRSRSNPSSNDTRKSASPSNNGAKSGMKIKSNDDSDNSSDNSIICLDAEISNDRVLNPSSTIRGNAMSGTERINNSSRGSTPLISSAPPSVPPTLPNLGNFTSSATGLDLNLMQSLPSDCNMVNGSGQLGLVNGSLRQRQPSHHPSLSYNGGTTPVLQTNGFNPPIFRPIIDETAKSKVAHELAMFLQTVCQKNSVSNSA